MEHTKTDDPESLDKMEKYRNSAAMLHVIDNKNRHRLAMWETADSQLRI